MSFPKPRGHSSSELERLISGKMAGEQDDPHSEGCRKMSGVTCGITVRRGTPGALQNLVGDGGRDMHFFLEEGSKETRGPRSRLIFAVEHLIPLH